jgi:hypothetical protein
MARCLLLEANLPKMMWTYAVMASAYIRNRCFNDRLGKTPYEALIGLKPNLRRLPTVLPTVSNICPCFKLKPI